MSIFLYRLGRFSYRRPWVFLITWFLILGSVITLAITGGVKISSAITIDGTESQAVIEELRSEFPDTAGGQGTIVFTSPSGERVDEGASAEAIRSSLTAISANEFVVERSTEDLAAVMPKPEDATGPIAPGDAPQPPEQMQGHAGQQVSPAEQEMMMQQALRQQGMLAPGVLISDDGTVALMQIQFSLQVEDLPAGVIDDVVTTATQQVKSPVVV